jgi:DNA-binding transcriptional regulator YhcF (GntR family)
MVLSSYLDNVILQIKDKKMPRAVDKIRNYINQEVASGNYTPGTRLPGYFELQKKFGISYQTVQTSMRKLAAEKLIDISVGKGCYIATPRTIRLDFYLPTTMAPASKIKALFDKHLDKSLNVDVNICSWKRYEINPPVDAEHVIMLNAAFDTHFSIPGLCSFGHFDDFTDIMSELETYNSGIDNAFRVPFSSSVSQMAINLDLLSSTGYNINDLDNNFDWWDDIAQRSKSYGKNISAQHCGAASPWWFGYFNALFFSLLINEKKSMDKLFDLPLFMTDSGSKLLDIIASHKMNRGNEHFFYGNTQIDIAVGSWIALQYKTREDFKVNNFIIKPYRYGKRKLCLISNKSLQTFMHHDLADSGRERIWEVVKTMLAKPFQLDYSNLTGMLSPRKDITADEYSWNDRSDFAVFIPDKQDIIIPSDIFSSHTLSAFATLIEQFVFHGAAKETILPQLEQKAIFNFKPQLMKGGSNMID